MRNFAAKIISITLVALLSFSATTGIAQSDNLATVSSFYADSGDWWMRIHPYAALDGNMETAWTLRKEDGILTRQITDGVEGYQNLTDGYIIISLGLEKEFDKVVLKSTDGLITKYWVDYLKDSKSMEWINVAKGTTVVEENITFPLVKSAAIKVTINTSKGGGGLNEIEVYNTKGEKLEVKPYGYEIALKINSPVSIVQSEKKMIDSGNKEITPLIINSRTLIPVRYISENIGASVVWNEQEKNVTISKDETVLRLKIGENKIISNETEIAIDTPAQIINNRTYLPLRAISEALGKKVFWDNKGLILIGNADIALTDAQTDFLVSNLSAMDGFTKMGQADIKIAPDATKITGKSLKYSAVRAELAYGKNEAAWMKYVAPNAVRTWTSSRTFLDPGIKVDLKNLSVKDLPEFEKLKEDVRLNPEKYIDWEKLDVRLDKDGKIIEGNLHYQYTTFPKLGMTVINCTGNAVWGDTWTDTFITWLKIYGTVYYLAKEYDIAIHQYANEPDNSIKAMTSERFIFTMQINSDAIHTAIDDVNKTYNKQLKGEFSGPVLAASSGMTQYAKDFLKYNYTNYKGEKTDKPILDIYNKNMYNPKPMAFYQEIKDLQKNMEELLPDKKALPILYSEFNYNPGGEWKKEIGVTSNTPNVFRNMGAAWGYSTLAGGYGMFMFTFTNGPHSLWTGLGAMTDKFDRETDKDVSDVKPNAFGGTIQIGYITKSAEVARMFYEGFKNEYDLYDCNLQSPDINYMALTSYNRDNNNYYMWLVQPNSKEDYNVELDLSGLQVEVGSIVTIKEVSVKKYGEVAYQISLPESKKIRVTQPVDSVWQVSVSKGAKLKLTTLHPTDDAQIVQGLSSDKNFGNLETMSVIRGENANQNNISFLKFNTGDLKLDKTGKAILSISGKQISQNPTPNGSTLRVYGILNDAWNENTLTNTNAPFVYKTVSSAKATEMDIDNLPVGHFNFTTTENYASIDITSFIKEHQDQEVTFVVIREMYWQNAEDKSYVDDNSLNDFVQLSTKESADKPMLSIWTQE